MVAIWFVPESHIYYARKGDHAKAKRSMLQLYNTAPGYDVEHEYAVVRLGIEAERELGGSGSLVWEIFNKKNWRRTMAGCLGICSQWGAGAPIVFTYSTVRSCR